MPRYKTASYFLFAFKKKRESFVALFMQQIKTPVAKGSSVPVCPAFLTFNFFFTMVTTAAEEIPAGLSIITIPLNSSGIKKPLLKSEVHVLKCLCDL